MHVIVKTVVAASVVAASTAFSVTPAAADPAKKTFQISVWCPNGDSAVYTDTTYVTSQIGAIPVWLRQPDGSYVKTAIVAAQEWQVSHDPGTPSPSDFDPTVNPDAVFLFSKQVGNRNGFGTVYHCIHFANWGTTEQPRYLEGPLDLAAVPS